MSNPLEKSLDDIIKEKKSQQKRGGADGDRKPRRRLGGNRGRRGGNRDRNRDDRDRRSSRGGDRSKSRSDRGYRRRDDESQPERKAKRRLRVTNLEFNITHKELMELFSKFGSLTKNKILYDNLGRSKGIAIIEYEKPESAEKAIAEYHGATLDGKVIGVEYDTLKKRTPGIRRKTIRKDRDGRRRDRSDRRGNRRTSDRSD